MSKFPLNKIIEVIWTDICTHNVGWQSVADAKNDSTLMEIKTIGYVLEDTPKLLKLAMMQAITNDGEIGVTAVIPKGVIKQFKVLKGI